MPDEKTEGLRDTQLVREDAKKQTWVCLMSKCVVSHFRITWPQTPDRYKEGTGPEACNPFPEEAAPREGTRALGR